MNQYLTINNFGPINNIENLEIKDFVVLIGERAVGKSTVAKSIYFFKSLREDLIDYYSECLRTGSYNFKPNDFGSRVKEKFIGIFGLSFGLSNDFKLRYQFTSDAENHIEVTVNDRKQLNVHFGPTFRGSHNTILSKCSEFNELNGKVDFSESQNPFIKSFYSQLEVDVSNLFSDNKSNFYIPAQRSFLAPLSEQLIIGQANLDYLTDTFVKRSNSIRNYFKSWGRNVNNGNTTLKGLSRQILKGSYEVTKKGEILRLGDGTEVSLAYISSGQQESLWILNTLVFLAENTQESFVVIEEPESHLDPKGQLRIVEAIAAFSNRSTDQVVITTHSPFVLAALNNLIYAFQVGANHNEEVSQIHLSDNTFLTNDFRLNPNKCIAYEITQNGGINIIDEEYLIENRRLDIASESINDIYNQLFEIANPITDEV